MRVLVVLALAIIALSAWSAPSVDAASVAVTERDLAVARQAFLEMELYAGNPPRRGTAPKPKPKPQARAPVGGARPAAQTAAQTNKPGATTKCGGNCPGGRCTECKCGSTVQRISAAQVDAPFYKFNSL